MRHTWIALITAAHAAVFTQIPGKNCGITGGSRRRHRRAMIVNGDSTDNTEYPWYAHFIASCGRQYGAAECGSSLISPDWLVTAAHCLADVQCASGGDFLEASWVVLGESKRARNGRRYTLKSVHVHPDDRLYDFVMQGYDVGLLETATRVVFSKYVMPICLPEADFCVNSHGSMATVTGFGKTTYDVNIGDLDDGIGRFTGETALTRQKVRLPFVNWTICDHLQQMLLGPKLSENDFCLGYKLGGKDSCQGDSGGPVMVDFEGVTYLYGLVSYGMNRGCGMHGMPSVYARVNSFYDWFHSVVKDTLSVPKGKGRCMEGVWRDDSGTTDDIGVVENWLSWDRSELEVINDWALHLQRELPFTDVSQLAERYRPLFLETVRELLSENVSNANLFCEIEKKSGSDDFFFCKQK